MKEMMIILFSGIFVENFVLAKFLGICPFLGVSKKLNTAMGMSTAVIFVMVISSIITYPINSLLLIPNGLDYLRTLIFILVIAALVQSIESVMKKMLPALYQSLGVYLPLITTNCAVLGVTILNVDKGLTFVGSVTNSLGAGLGFMLAMFLFAGVRGRLEQSDVPKSLQGLPITLIAASIVSVSFFGFKGIIEKLFA